MDVKKERPQQRIGVYGGTFDPIHHGHLQVVAAITQAFALDSLLLVPAFVPPHKRTRMISSSWHRYAMLALATADSEMMKLSTIELEAPTRPWTIDTLGRLKEENPSAQLFFIMGADSFADVTSWREYERLLREYHIIVALRPGYESDGSPGAHLSPQLRAQIVDLRGGRLPDEESLMTPHTWLTDYLEVDISASRIREAVRQGLPIDDFVPPVVARYIEKHGLYRQRD
jgi:nicotinate-nucleotide adenylyltransferase